MKPKSTCEYCNIQRALHRCWTMIENLPMMGTVDQNDAVALAANAISLAHNLYDHDCEFNVSSAALQEAADVR